MKNNLIITLFKILVISIILYSCQDEKITPKEELNAVILDFASKSSISYDFNFRMKFLDYPDTTSFSGKAVMIKKESDTLFGAHIWMSRTGDINDYIKYYDSKHFYAIDNKSKQVTVYDITDPIPYGFKNNFDGRFVNTYFIKNYKLNKLLNDSIYKTKVQKVDGNSQLIVNYPDDEDVVNMVKKITFDNSKSAIKNIIYKAQIDSLHEFSEWNLSNIQFDSNTPEELEQEFIKITKDYTFKNYKNPSKKDNSPLTLGEQAVNFKGVYLKDGEKEFNLKDHLGKVVILDFWYKTCPPCIKSMPQLNNVFEKYNSRGVKLFGVNNIDTDSLSKSQLPPFIKNKNIKYPIVLTDRYVSETNKVVGYPTLYIIDKKGEIAYSKLGYSQNLEKDVDSILNIILK